MEKNNITTRLSAIQEYYLTVASTLVIMEIIRRKIETRGWQDFDREDLLTELNTLEAKLTQLDGALLQLRVDLQS